MATLTSINPFTEEINATFETLDATQVDSIIMRSHDAYLSWRTTPSSYKKKLFLKLADILDADIEECSRLETIEMGMLNHASKA